MINFLHSSQYRTLFGISAGNSDDNSGMFSLPLNRAKAFSAFHPSSGGAGGAQGVGGTQLGQLTPGPSQTMWCHAQHTEQGEEGGVDIQSDGICHW